MLTNLPMSAIMGIGIREGSRRSCHDGGGRILFFEDREIFFAFLEALQEGGDVHGHDLGIILPVLHAINSCNSSDDGYLQ